jgi:Flp pilus assembly protein TadD
MFVSTGIFAAGGGSMPMTPQAVQKTPGEKAVDSYNAGLKARDKAWQYQKRAATESRPKKAKKLIARADKQFAKAVKKFRTAVRYEPRLYQAHGSLGYALKQRGDFSGAMAAYEHCLKLRPNYTPAIEYRAEAHLALGETDKARQAYVQLAKLDPPKADELEQAIRAWLENPPADLEPGLVDDMRTWVVTNLSS